MSLFAGRSVDDAFQAFRALSQPIENADRARPDPQGSSRDESVQSEKQPAESESAKPLADPPQKDREIAAGRADSSNKLEPSKKVTGPKSVTLRELRIDPHGAPQKEESNRSKPAPSDDDRATVSDDDRSPDDGRSATDSRVSETSEDPELAEAPVPSEPEYDYSGFPLEPLTLNRTVRGMQRSMKACLQYYYARPEVADQRSNWGMLHSIMVYGVDTKVIVGRKKYSAIAWIAGNNPCRGQRLLVKGNQGIEALSGVGLQGHQGQMLAVFGLCGVPGDYPLYAGDTKYSVNDVLEAEMKACREDAELTFTLIGLAHYLDTDESWVASDGQRWDFERLIRSELSQPIVGSACGGTHRLMGFAHALRKRRAEGRPINGQWRRAELFLEDFQSYCYRLQNRDGSMSTDWFEGREDNGDLDRKIQTTGHMVEWLLTVTPDSQLQNPRLVSAVRFLLVSMYNQRTRDWAIGPKGHALRSLAMFYERAYRSGPAWQDTQVASGHRSSHR